MTAHETGFPPPNLLVTGHFHERPGYAVYRRHGSGNWLITYTVAGHGLYRQPGVALRTDPGDVVLLQPGALHDYSVPPGEAWEFLWAHFHPRPAWLSWWRLPAVGQGLFRAALHAPTARARAYEAFLRAHADACTAAPMADELALNALEEILLLAGRESERPDRRSLDPRVQQILDLFAADLAAPHDLTSLARAVALSPSRLAHLFKEEVGDSPANTLLSLRLRQAARLLRFTSRDVGAIAVDVGFNSPFYFSRQFHRHVGISPRAYRAAATDETQASPEA